MIMKMTMKCFYWCFAEGAKTNIVFMCGTFLLLISKDPKTSILKAQIMQQ